ncbi:MAG: N(G),N(G)-dimethylarginine dimethylaminohydrolase [Gemmatimonadaceae bacterium]|nr:N(G),N(G)-dimethylarginine dimethylaminohydrolase [Gemmatimonadaceae bacterium]
MAWLALTRAVSPTLADCELTHLDRTPIDVARAEAQHAAYEQALRSLGCDVRRVPAAPENPDAVFIEDTAVVLDELAVITRPGAESRRSELEPVAEVLATLRPLHRLEAPGTLDGGDVMVVGSTIFVGRTLRTNDDGIAQLRAAVAPFGYRVIAVEVTGCLHLKSAVTALDTDTVLCNPAWVDPAAFAPKAAALVADDEPNAANVVRVGERLLAAEGYPRTNAMLRARGYSVTTVPADELAKAEGAVTCCSLIVRVG